MWETTLICKDFCTIGCLSNRYLNDDLMERKKENDAYRVIMKSKWLWCEEYRYLYLPSAKRFRWTSGICFIALSRIYHGGSSTCLPHNRLSHDTFAHFEYIYSKPNWDIGVQLSAIFDPLIFIYTYHYWCLKLPF